MLDEPDNATREKRPDVNSSEIQGDPVAESVAQAQQFRCRDSLLSGYQLQ